ncbi:MAG TPA: FxLYD domain-containing protein [Candidatus Acidoferrum sp.]|nr:FxLYD domain-containing protein [Candidatus Acidoferrum sp.]
MLEAKPIKGDEAPQPPRGRPLILWMGLATVAIVLAVVMWPGERSSSSSRFREAHFPFGLAEQAYVTHIQIDSLKLSRAENFLNQEVTILSGRLNNNGKSSLSNVELTVEFSDELGQIILRESRPAFAPREAQLAPGQTRDFEVSFEHIPPSWNIQQPTVRVTGILFNSAKE